MIITAMFKIRYHFQFKSFEDGIWRSVYGYNDEDMARETFRDEEKSRENGAWANAIRLFDLDEGKVLLEAEADPTGGITLAELDFRLADGQTVEEIQQNLQSKAREPVAPEGSILPFDHDKLEE